MAGAWRARRTLSALQTALSSIAHSLPGMAVVCAMKQIASRMMAERRCMVTMPLVENWIPRKIQGYEANSVEEERRVNLSYYPFEVLECGHEFCNVAALCIMPYLHTCASRFSIGSRKLGPWIVFRMAGDLAPLTCHGSSLMPRRANG